MKTTLLTILFLPLLIINNEKPVESLKIQTPPDNSFQFNKSDTTYFVSTNKEHKVVYDFVFKGKNYQKPNFKIDFTKNGKTLENVFLTTSAKQYFKTNDGWLIGCNSGEYGGGLFWFNEVGTEYKRINNSNIISIFLFNNEIYYLSGLAHLSLNYGKLSKIKKHDNEWKVVKSIDLKTRPYAYTLSPRGNLLIVTGDLLLKVDKSNKVKNILKSSFWKYLYPSSIVFKHNEIFIGMRGGIMKVNYKKPKNQVWLTE